MRRAGAEYQRTRRGAQLHAARMRRWRERAKFGTQKVTHQTVTQAAAEGKPRGDESVRPATVVVDVERCSLCGMRLPSWARLGPPRLRRARSPRTAVGPPR
jgi:hypothetical protein